MKAMVIREVTAIVTPDGIFRGLFWPDGEFMQPAAEELILPQRDDVDGLYNVTPDEIFAALWSPR